MPRLALLNILVGFVVLCLSAATGAFIANDLTEAFVHDPEALHSWSNVLLSSSHGHSNLFGFLHIVFGITMPYSALDHRAKVLQSIGLFLGVVAMGPGMMVRSYFQPAADDVDAIGFVIGALLFANLAALAGHCYGLALKLKRV